MVWCACKRCYVDGGDAYTRRGGDLCHFREIKDGCSEYDYIVDSTLSVDAYCPDPDGPVYVKSFLLALEGMTGQESRRILVKDGEYNASVAS